MTGSQRLPRRQAEGGNQGVVAGQRARQLLDVEGIALHDLKRALIAGNLLGRAHERGRRVAARERDVKDLGPHMAGGTEHEDTHDLMTT
jgi:hypothetical protein